MEENRLGNGKDEIRIERGVLRRVIDQEVQRESGKSGGGDGSRWVSRSPLRRSEINLNSSVRDRR